MTEAVDRTEGCFIGQVRDKSSYSLHDTDESYHWAQNRVFGPALGSGLIFLSVLLVLEADPYVLSEGSKVWVIMVKFFAG